MFLPRLPNPSLRVAPPARRLHPGVARVTTCLGACRGRHHEWELGLLPASLKPAQADIGWAQHIVLFFPLWLGDMPALLKGFLEQVARPGFAFNTEGSNPFGRKGLTGRSARVVVTMGMPALVYRWYFRAHSVKS